MKRLFVFALLAVLAACGGKTGSGQDLNKDGIDDPTNPLVPDSVTVVAPSSPKGRVSGRVTEMTGKAMAEADVVISSPDATEAAKTDANGVFVVQNVTAGSLVGVFVSKAGFAPAWTTAIIPVAAGNFPLNNGEAFVGTISLLPTSGSVTFNVVGFDGKPINGTATLDVNPGFVINSGGNNAGAGDITVSAAIVEGVLTFTGVPKVEDAAWMTSADVPVKYTVYVNPVIDAATGIGYGGSILTLAAAKMLTEPWNRTLVLPPASDSADLAIVATNVHNLVKAPSPANDNLIAKSGTIYVAFNQPIGPDVFVEIRNDDPDIADSAVIGINDPKATMNTLGTELKITPKAPGFVDGQKYNLVIQASSRDNPAGGIKTFSAPFFGGDPAVAKSLGTPLINLNEMGIGNDTWDLAETLEIVFDKYIGRGDGTAPTIPIYFDNDLNNNGETGDVRGELGSNQPICITGSEEVPGFFPAKASGYAKKFAITPASMAGSYTKTLSSTEISITIAFNESFKCTGGAVHSVWGEAQSTTLPKLQVTVVPPP
ncbi:MAG TPA: carboxypeptidase-like regulatory domain-containing protein [Myxococcales bacterium]